VTQAPLRLQVLLAFVLLCALVLCGGAALAATSSIELSEYRDGRIFQRNRAHRARLPIAGRYAGAPRAIEARVVADRSSAEIVPWTVIDEAPMGGRFRGSLAKVPQGGWYRLEVRFAGEPSVRRRATARFGVGVLVACAGQSHIAYWFRDGPVGPEDEGWAPPAPHRLARMFRHDGFLDENKRTNDWRPISGVGATVFANALIEALGVPVGLLPYGVGSSALWQANALTPHPDVRNAPRTYGWWLADGSGRYPLRDNYAHLRGGLVSVGREVEALLWVQGETDAIARDTAAHYAAGLASLFARFRFETRRADLPIFLSLLGRQSKVPWAKVIEDVSAQAIRDAQVWAAERDPSTHLAATTIDLPLSHDGIHLSRIGQALHAARMATAVIATLEGEDETRYRGPRLDRLDLRDSYVDVWVAHRGGSDFGPPTGIRGFEVFGPAAGRVVGAWRRDASTIRLAVSGEASSVTAVCYLRGANPGGLDPLLYARRYVHDDSPLALPLEAGCLTAGDR